MKHEIVKQAIIPAIRQLQFPSLVSLVFRCHFDSIRINRFALIKQSSAGGQSQNAECRLHAADFMAEEGWKNKQLVA